MLKLLTDSTHEVPSSADTQEASTSKLVLKEFLRRDELAQQLGISPRTILRWQALRKGPPRVCVGRTILYSIQSVCDWLHSREQEQQAPFRLKKSRGLPNRRRSRAY